MAENSGNKQSGEKPNILIIKHTPRQVDESLRQGYDACTKSFEKFKKSLRIPSSISEKPETLNEKIPCSNCPFYSSEIFMIKIGLPYAVAEKNHYYGNQRTIHSCDKHGYKKDS